MNTDYTFLKAKLEQVYKTFDNRYLNTDPLYFSHQYSGKQNREIVGLISAVLAYGNVKQIRVSIQTALEPLGLSPIDTIKKLDPYQAAKEYQSFVHRFNTGKDIALLLYYLHQIYTCYPSLEDFFLKGFNSEDPTIEEGLSQFARNLFMLDCSPFYQGVLPPDAGVRYLITSPAKGSACKRLNMFLRWMIRPDDGVDFGLWKGVDASQLIFPMDAHTARISYYIGLTERKSASWKMALEVTENVKKIASDDPVKYDFALSRLGILDLCEHSYKKVLCEQCQLLKLCRLVPQAV